MSSGAESAPQRLFAKLCVGARRQKRRNLTIVHKLCEEFCTQGLPLTYAAVGRSSAGRGGISQAALYNASSTDYRLLIDAWKACKGNHDSPADDRLTQAILETADPRMRVLYDRLVAERDRLKAALNTLRAHSSIVIDRRSHSAKKATDGLSLLPHELDAIRAFIEPGHLEAEGWTRGRRGELIAKSGRHIARAGFATALAKAVAIQSEKARSA